MTADARKLADLLENNGLDRAAMRLGANYPDALALILAALRAYEAPCATCNGDPEVCATVPGLRHCEAANREHPYVDDAEDAARYRWFRDECAWFRRADIVEVAGEDGAMLEHHIDKGRCGL